MDRLFARFANATARVAGSPTAFLICVLVVVIWAVSTWKPQAAEYY